MRWWRGPAGYLVTVAGMLAVWQLLSLRAGSSVLPPPWAVLVRLAAELREPAYWAHVTASLWRMSAGIGLAFLVGVPWGLALGASPRLDAFFRPLIYLSYPIPKIVLLPVILLLFGLGETSKIVLIFIILLFQVLISTRDSARQIGRATVYSLRSLGGGRWDLLRHVIWPVSLPGIFTALRVGTGTAVAVLFFVESIATSRGLGIYLIDAWGRADYPGMFAGIVSLSLLGILFYELFDLLERRLCRWRDA